MAYVNGNHRYETSGSMPLGNQISCKNPNSNVDIDYGPYKDITLEDIQTMLKNTLQLGKTIGLIENGAVVEYWAQPVDGNEAKLAFVKKGGVSEVNDISDASIEGLFRTK